MRWIRSFSVAVVLILLVDSCLKQPEYNVIPDITLQDLIFKPKTSQSLDSLNIILHFKDGDGDLGISDTSAFDSHNPVYFAYDTITYQVGVTVYKTTPLPGAYKFLDYKARKLAQFDTLPALNCTNWEILNKKSGSGTTAKDTLYIQQNAHAYNIFVKLYQKDANGTYVQFDPTTYFQFPGCNVNMFTAGFPDLSGDSGNKSPIEGTLTYSVLSSVTNLLFNNKVLKIQIYITDRAFHKSNVVEKEGFTLASITK